jgi:hypothetical protein
MFGHGQIEGYAEKYGMEYPRAYWNEQPDEYLIERHRKEIFPLLHRRALFAGSENFTLYDFWTGEGAVNEDVFAYSNRVGDERALVIYHNRFAETAGWVRTSVGFAQKKPDCEKAIVQRNLCEALGLAADEKSWVIFRDNSSGLEYLRSARELRDSGLFVQLNAYGCHVFLDWREVCDEAGLYEQLAAKLEGRGVPSIEAALRASFLEPLHAAFREVADAALWRALVEAGSTRGAQAKAKTSARFDEFGNRVVVFGRAACEFYGIEGDAAALGRSARAHMERALQPPKTGRNKAARAAAEKFSAPFARGVLIVWSLASSLGALESDEADGLSNAERARRRFDQWLLGTPCATALRAFGLDDGEAVRAVALARILTMLAAPGQSAFELVSRLLADTTTQELLGLNRHNGVTWFLKEGMDEVLDWLQLIANLETIALPLDTVRAIAEQSEYRVVKLLELARRA